MPIDRRYFLLGLAALPVAAGAAPRRRDGARAALRRLRDRLGPGGRLGVAAWEGRSGRSLGLDPSGHYALCSTFKLPLAALMLAGAERGRWRLSDEIRFGAGDLLDYAPVVRAQLARGRMTIEAMCAAIVEVSDNAAANLLLRRIGGPSALTAFIRSCGDRVTRLDRYETQLNSNFPGDLRDTTSPAAMLALMRVLLFGGRLRPESRARLAGWMVNASTGRERLRAGFPAGWRVGDKTGNGANGAANDIGFAIPPGRAPILVASYASGGNAPVGVRNAVHASIARIVAGAFA